MDNQVIIGIIGLGIAVYALFKDGNVVENKTIELPFSIPTGEVVNPFKMVDECGPENPLGSACYPNATGSWCNVDCNTRCTDSVGNYKVCDVLPLGLIDTFVDPYRDQVVVPDSYNPLGLYPDIYGNLMQAGREVCHRGDVVCAHNLVGAGVWSGVYD